jgi:hypothetical protein
VLNGEVMMSDLLLENGRRLLFVGAALLNFTGCAAPRQHPEPAALVAKAELPPHVIEVAQGLYSCERGYLIKQGRCIPYEELSHRPVVEISSLPSAGEGASGGRACPSGGCGSYVAPPSYSTFVYSGAGSHDYWPGLYYGGALCPPHVRRFRGGEFAFGGRAGSFVRERRVASGGFFGAPSYSLSKRRSQPRGMFGGNRTGRGR